MGMSLSELREVVMAREAWRAAIHGVAKSWTRLSDWTELISKDWNDEEGDEEMSETVAGKSMDMEESSQGSATSDQLQN